MDYECRSGAVWQLAKAVEPVPERRRIGAVRRNDTVERSARLGGARPFEQTAAVRKKTGGGGAAVVRLRGRRI
ncbi:glycerophosphodiester phosphodiesterase 1 isoform X1 [Sesbania bispinosa]|nr:glycerophosphodiester phosphodiesterase 1 isoform X1 [Sesbania bispinosa]